MKCIFSAILLLMAFKLSATQLPLFSSFNTAMQYYNPAYSGMENKFSLAYNQSLKRLEFHKVNLHGGTLYADPFDNAHYFNVIVSTPLRLKDKSNSGIGLMYTRNNDGLYQSSDNFAINFSHPITQLKNGDIRLGLSGSYTQFEFEMSKFNQMNPFQPDNFKDFKNNTFNYTIGLMFKNDSNTFNCGVSLMNARAVEFSAYTNDQKVEMLYQVIPHFTCNASLVSELSEKWSIQNSFIATVQAMNVRKKDLMLQSIVYYRSLGLGVQFYSSVPKIGPTLAYKKTRFEMSYTYLYDFYLKWGVVGIHQLGLKYCFNSPK